MEPALPVPAAVLTEPSPQFDALIGRLDALSRNHLLYFRIEVGRAVLEELFGGDVEALRDRSPTKELSLREFARAHAERLSDLGLNETRLRQSIDAHLVVAHLPEDVVRQLVFTHVVELARVADVHTRSLLARAAIENAWSGQALRDAVLRVRAGQWIDADLQTEGLQPSGPAPLPPEAEKKLPPARIVTRVERSVEAFVETTSPWDELPVASLTDVQRSRVEQALAGLEARIGEIRRRLGG